MRKASKRAADLTKKLLSFSRRQVMEKRVFRVEETIDGIKTLLERSTGERYSLEFEEEFTPIRKNLTPGRFVEVSVIDTGSGIEPETLAHIFEPFFTTKD